MIGRSAPHLARGIVAAAVLFAACSTEAPAPRSSAPRTTVTVRDAPSELIVGLRDLPPGYSLEDDAPVTLDAMSGGGDRGIMREQMSRVGVLSGHHRTFALSGLPSAERSAAVDLFILRDAAAASDALDKAVPTDPMVSRVAIGQAVGDKSHGYRVTQTGSDGVDYDAVMVEFQYGNTVCYVIVQGRSTFSIQEVSRLALTQLARLRADAQGPPLATPTPRTSPISPVYSNLSLRVGDLPTGYQTTFEEALSASDFANESVTEDMWRAVGFRGAYGHSFVSRDQSTVVTSVVILCDAKKTEQALGLAVGRAKALDAYEISIGAPVGDEAVGIEFSGNVTAGGQTQHMTYRSVYFRFGDSVGWINVRAPTGAVDAAFMVDLARKLIDHLQ